MLLWNSVYWNENKKGFRHPKTLKIKAVKITTYFLIFCFLLKSLLIASHSPQIANFEMTRQHICKNQELDTIRKQGKVPKPRFCSGTYSSLFCLFLCFRLRWLLLFGIKEAMEPSSNRFDFHLNLRRCWTSDFVDCFSAYAFE